jgi:hypothetical protein
MGTQSPHPLLSLALPFARGRPALLAATAA